VRTRLAVIVVGLATLLPMVIGFGFDAATADRVEPVGPGLVTINLDMRYSRFSQKELHVYQGTLVRFVVTNSDPIHHELIVGPPSVHDRHEGGHDKQHPPVPGEVGVNPGDTGLTTYRFDQVGDVLYACHAPGHFNYGMTGHVIVHPLPVP
jgi:uncharacterized cupredoxin-like copper-binding protein